MTDPFITLTRKIKHDIMSKNHHRGYQDEEVSCPICYSTCKMRQVNDHVRRSIHQDNLQNYLKEKHQSNKRYNHLGYEIKK